MRLNTLMSVYAWVAGIFCAGLLLIPAFWNALYGAAVDTQATVLLRLVGALFGGLAIMVWIGRNAERSKSRDAMVLGLAVLNGLAAGVALLGALSGVYNQFSWGPVATFTMFCIGFLVVGQAGRSHSTPDRSPS